MNKILYLQDEHCQGVNSCSRLGNYFEDWLVKFDESLNIAKECKCNAILDGGDLLEVKKPAYNVIDEIVDRIEKIGIPFYSLHGNHCMNSGHIENSVNTGLTHIQKRSNTCYYLDQIEGSNYIIKGIDYKFGIEDEIKKNGITAQTIENKWKIVILHAMVTPTKFFKNASYILPKEIKTNADLVLCSHYHHPFKKVIGNTTFLNIGAMGRLNINEANIEPSVLLLDTDKKSYEIIKLKSAKPASKIFDLEKHEKLKIEAKSIEDYLNLLNDVDFCELDILGQIEHFAKESRSEKRVVDYLINKVKETKNDK